MKRLSYAVIMLTLLIVLFVPSPMLAVPRAIAIDPRLPDDVVYRWYTLSDMYPYAAGEIADLKAVYWSRAGWLVQLDASTVYINLSLTRCKKIAVWCVGGRVDHAEELTRQFAMRVWTRMLRDNPQMAACFGRREVFVAMLLLRAR